MHHFRGDSNAHDRLIKCKITQFSHSLVEYRFQTYNYAKLFFIFILSHLILMTLSSFCGIIQLLLLHRLILNYLRRRKQPSSVPWFLSCLPRKSVFVTMIRLRGVSERSTVFRLRFGMLSVVKIIHLLLKGIKYRTW